jgi:hypothetical protein
MRHRDLGQTQGHNFLGAALSRDIENTQIIFTSLPRNFEEL